MKAYLVWMGACSLVLVAAAPGGHAACDAGNGLPCAVTRSDFLVLRRAFQCALGDPCYDPRADYDSDGRVGIKDFTYFKILFSRGPDVTPPTIVITTPSANQTLTGVVTISVSATDDVGIRGVSTFFEEIDSYPIQDILPPYQTTLDTRTIPNGDHVIRANAYDISGNMKSHRIAVEIDNRSPPSAGSPPGVVRIDDLNGDGRYTGEDVKIGLAICVPGCTLRALRRTYDDVEVAIPAGMTNGVTIEGAGMGQTVFRSPVPWVRSVVTVSSPNPLVTFRDLTIDGRKAEQISAFISTQSQIGIRVANPAAADSGPGIIERVEIKNMLNEGISISGGSGWIVRHNKIHDNGCSNRFPCPSLRLVDLGAHLHDPTWQSVGFGIIFESSDNTAHDNEIWNINKIGIEAFDSVLLPYSELMSGFHIHHNHVHHVGSGIGSNGGRSGRIENNTVTHTSGYGVFCGGQAGDLVFNNNLIVDNNFAGLWVSCWGPNITVTNNRIGNNCQTIPGGSSGLHIDAGTQFGGGNGLTIQDNTVDEPFCRSASEISYRDDVQISGNVFRGGSALGTVILHDVTDVVMSDTYIDGEGRVPAGIFLLPNVNGLTVRSDVTTTGYTLSRFLVSNPASVTNVVIE